MSEAEKAKMKEIGFWLVQLSNLTTGTSRDACLLRQISLALADLATVIDGEQHGNV